MPTPKPRTLIADQAKLDPQAAAEALAETYSQLLNDDVYIERSEVDSSETRTLTYRGLTLARVEYDGTIVVNMSLKELLPLARVA